MAFWDGEDVAEVLDLRFLRIFRFNVMWNWFEQNSTTPLVCEVLLSLVCTLTCLYHISKGHSNSHFIPFTFLSVKY